MRTTLDIDDDVLLAAKELARREHASTGKIVSDLVRRALTQPPSSNVGKAREPEQIHGFRPFPSRGGVATNELVDRLRDDEGV